MEDTQAHEHWTDPLRERKPELERELSYISTDLRDFTTHTPNSSEEVKNVSERMAISPLPISRSARPSLLRASSSRSSISSFPGSVLHHSTVETDAEASYFPRTSSPVKSVLQQSYRVSGSPRAAQHSEGLSGFRSPSSIRAQQLESEWEMESQIQESDNDYLNAIQDIAYRNVILRRSSRPGSHSRNGSIQSSPVKRTSRPSTPLRQIYGHRHTQSLSRSKPRKEDFPLVLLHCSLLPTAFPVATTQSQTDISPSTTPISQDLLSAVLPEPYQSRFVRLQDKIQKNAEVVSRGVLLAHPQDDYELLEERLLEALELERPRSRIQHGHYITSTDAESEEKALDSGFESASQGSSEVEETTAQSVKLTDNSLNENQTQISSGINVQQQEKCQQCGHCIPLTTGLAEPVHQKWIIKIFAANGLLTPLAWSAAWQEMEKVDVSISVWLPDEVKAEVENRVAMLVASEASRAKRNQATSSSVPRRHLDEELNASTGANLNFQDRKGEEEEAPPIVTPSRQRRRKSERRKREEARMKEIYGEPGKARITSELDNGVEEDKPRVSFEETTEQIEPATILEDSLAKHEDYSNLSLQPESDTDRLSSRDHNHDGVGHSTSIKRLPLSTLLRRYITAQISDTRNVSILLLSSLVILLVVSMQAYHQHPPSQGSHAMNISISSANGELLESASVRQTSGYMLEHTVPHNEHRSQSSHETSSNPAYLVGSMLRNDLACSSIGV